MPAQSELKARATAAVTASRDEILALSHAIHADPEPAFEEHRAAARVAEAIAGHGYAVEHPAGRLPTAVRGRLSRWARPGRSADRHPGGIRRVARPRPRLRPQHDGGLRRGRGDRPRGRARRLRRRGGLPGHPGRGTGQRASSSCWTTGSSTGSTRRSSSIPPTGTWSTASLLASEDVDVAFAGKAAHAASEPWEGRNALDAVVLLLQAIGLWRQQLPQHARVHGIVIEGGTAANIIPDRATARFMIRSTDQVYFESMRERFRALVVGGRHDGRRDRRGHLLGRLDHDEGQPNAGRALAGQHGGDGTRRRGRGPGAHRELGHGQRVASVPTIHPSLAICDHGVAWHSIESLRAAATPRADETTLLAASLVARTALDLLVDPALVATAWEEFRGAPGAGEPRVTDADRSCRRGAVRPPRARRP